MQTREPVQVPIQIKVTESQMSQETTLTNRISSIFFLWGTPIEKDETALAANGLTVTDLMTSSDNTWDEVWTEGPLLGSMLNPNGKTMLGTLPLAVMVEGTFPDTFAGRVVPDWPEAAATEGQAPAEPPTGPSLPDELAPQPGSLILIGSAKMFDDNILAAQQNALLLLNAVDYLAGSHELLSIRSKTLTQRVIKPIDSNQKMAWRIFVVLFVPILIAVFGFVRAGMRRRDASAYRSQFQRPGHNR